MRLAAALLLLFWTIADGDFFVDVTKDSGIDFVHYNAATNEKYMVESIGSGGGFLTTTATVTSTYTFLMAPPYPARRRVMSRR